MEDLEALLTDLQNTTAVLKGANPSPDQTQAFEESEIQMSAQSHQHSVPPTQNLHDLEQMLDDFSSHRGKATRPTVESLLDELDSAVVPNGDVREYTHHHYQPAAQAASKDLDHLMDSLNKFKVQGSHHDPSYAQPLKSPRSNPNQLDSMLGQLDSDMSKHGISTVPKGDCAACDKSIVGQVVIALGKMWHPEHFTCAHCGEMLGHKNFFERTGRAYCEHDYHNLFSPRCAYCNGPIKDKCITALDKTWHPEHFFCAQCGKDFGEEGFHERDGKAFCRADYFSMFAPKCRGCDRAIMHNYITALGTQWHPECFVCQDHEKAIFGDRYAEVVCEMTQ